MKKELLDGLTVEQIEKVKACKTSEEVLSLAKKEGIELTTEQLAAVNGGGCIESWLNPRDEDD
ncbi:MAG: Nif11-like leader peptide family natural product precursor [Bacilli bacterium]|nr:Nif11-like leader peptide family natural product precursor [Bacilli bacterium]